MPPHSFSSGGKDYGFLLSSFKMEGLMVTDDWYGDLIRDFFAKYGADGEGPPPDMNLCELFGIGPTVSGDLKADIDIICRCLKIS
jgi:hypothetical protein